MDDRKRRTARFSTTIHRLASLPDRRFTSCLTIAIGLLAFPSHSDCQVACKPFITVKTVQVSDVYDMQRVWTAVLLVDGAYCANSLGRFEIDFLREKESTPDMQFTQQFEWKPGEIKVSINLWWDEIVQNFRIGFIAPCVCREFQF